MKTRMLTGLVCLVVGAPGVTWGVLEGQYYESDTAGEFTTLAATEWDLSVDFDWGTGGPGVLGGLSDLFAVRWTGTFHSDRQGTYAFYSITDDGARLYVDGELLIDKWVDQGATEYSGSIELDAGTDYDLVFEYYENTGGAMCRLLYAGPGISKQAIPPTAFMQPEDGFAAQFYNNLAPLSAPAVFAINVPQVAFDWGSGAPAVGINQDNFSARFQGWIVAPEDGTYTFTVASDDGSDLYVGGESVIHQFAVPQPITEHSGTISLVAGEQYLVDLRYAEIGGNAACYLYWQAPSMTERAGLGDTDVEPAMQIVGVSGREGVRHRVVAVGSNLTFAIEVEQALAAPTYAWHFLPDGESPIEQVLATGTAADSIISLTVEEIPFEGSGSYWCVVDDGRGAMASFPFTVEVVEAVPAPHGVWLLAIMAAMGLLASFGLRRQATSSLR